jgi:hypothetical protein
LNYRRRHEQNAVTDTPGLNVEAPQNRRKVEMKSSIMTGLLVGLALMLSGCIVAPGPGGWCYYHPYRCSR